MIKRKSMRSVWPVVAGMAFGIGVAAGGYFLGKSTLVHDLFTGTPGWAVFAALFIAVPLPLFVHEAGHVVGGLLVKFRFLLYVAGPVMVERQGERIVARWHRHWGMYGGLAAMAPTDDRDLLRRMSWMVAAGPLASLLLTVVSLVGALAVGDGAPGLRFMLGVLTLSAGMNVLAVTLPSRTGGFLTDRSRFILLRRGGPAAELAVALALLGARSQSGERPREWPSSALLRLEAAETEDLDAVVGRFSYLVAYYEDCDQMERALAELDRAIARIDSLPAILHPMLWLEHAYLVATVNADAAAARASFQRVGPRAFVEAWQRDRAEAAIFRSEGRLPEAWAAAQKALAAMPATIPAGTAAFVREQLGPMARP